MNEVQLVTMNIKPISSSASSSSASLLLDSDTFHNVDDDDLDLDDDDVGMLKKSLRYLAKLNVKLKQKIDHIKEAKIILKYLRNIRCGIISNVKIGYRLFQSGLLSLILSASLSFFSFAFLIDEAYRCIIPLISNHHINNFEVIIQLVDHGIFIFCLTSIKKYMNEKGICLQSIQIIDVCLDFLIQDESNQPPNDRSQTSRITNQTTTHRKKKTKDITHQLIFHGAVSNLPKLLSKFSELKQEIGIKAVIKVLRFIILYIPSTTNTSLVYRIATNDDWCCVHALLSVLRNYTSQAAVDAAALLLCMVADSEEVALELRPSRGWDDISSTVAGNIEALRARVSRKWLLKAQQRIARLLQGDEQHSSLADPALEAMQSVLSQLLMDDTLGEMVGGGQQSRRSSLTTLRLDHRGDDSDSNSDKIASVRGTGPGFGIGLEPEKREGQSISSGGKGITVLPNNSSAAGAGAGGADNSTVHFEDESIIHSNNGGSNNSGYGSSSAPCTIQSSLLSTLPSSYWINYPRLPRPRQKLALQSGFERLKTNPISQSIHSSIEEIFVDPILKKKMYRNVGSSCKTYGHKKISDEVESSETLVQSHTKSEKFGSKGIAKEKMQMQPSNLPSNDIVEFTNSVIVNHLFGQNQDANLNNSSSSNSNQQSKDMKSMNFADRLDVLLNAVKAVDKSISR